jgi:hypothetical protein
LRERSPSPAIRGQAAYDENQAGQRKHVPDEEGNSAEEITQIQPEIDNIHRRTPEDGDEERDKTSWEPLVRGHWFFGASVAASHVCAAKLRHRGSFSFTAGS